jgi:hypothetical protein
MSDKNRNIIEVKQLRPTQMTVGMLQVKHKRARLRELEKRPAELLDFILEHPVRVVLGPKEKVYVIDHHHLALALMKQKLETAPMNVEDDFSSLSLADFWKKMKAHEFVHPYDANGKLKPLSSIPKTLKLLTDDPYRSLAGYVREAGGFTKVPEPFAEFLWADYYRMHIKLKLVDTHFKRALNQAMRLSRHEGATQLPGYVKKPAK